MNLKSKTLVIAEAGVNHNGSREKALELINQAKLCGADYVKFQTFKASNLVSKNAKTAAYQRENLSGQTSQFDMLKKLELTEEDHQALIEHCIKKEIKFLSAPFDIESVDLLTDKYKLPLIKIPSGEITNAPLLLRIASKGVNIILSTGLSNLADIEGALGVIAFGFLNFLKLKSVGGKSNSEIISKQANLYKGINLNNPTKAEFYKAYVLAEGQNLLREKLTLLHCTSQYPTPYNEVNLKAMKTLNVAYGLDVGLSDHTKGIAIPIAATALGARVIEKHFTLDKNLPGPDHKSSLEPSEFMAMVDGIRQTESALGHGIKIPSESESENLKCVRKSIVAATNIKKGTIFTNANITCKRGEMGISPMDFWSCLGTIAKRDYIKDELID